MQAKFLAGNGEERLHIFGEVSSSPHITFDWINLCIHPQVQKYFNVLQEDKRGRLLCEKNT